MQKGLSIYIWSASFLLEIMLSNTSDVTRNLSCSRTSITGRWFGILRRRLQRRRLRFSKLLEWDYSPKQFHPSASIGWERFWGTVQEGRRRCFKISCQWSRKSFRSCEREERPSSWGVWEINCHSPTIHLPLWYVRCLCGAHVNSALTYDEMYKEIKNWKKLFMYSVHSPQLLGTFSHCPILTRLCSDSWYQSLWSELY